MIFHSYVSLPEVFHMNGGMTIWPPPLLMGYPVPPSEVLQSYLFWSLKVGCNMRQPHSLKLEYLCKYSNIYIYIFYTQKKLYTHIYIHKYLHKYTQHHPKMTSQHRPTFPAKQRYRVVVGNGDMEDHFGLSLVWPLFLGGSHGTSWDYGLGT